METIRKGSKSIDVLSLQASLGLKMDGDFGEKTETGVKDFQESHGLKIDGVDPTEEQILAGNYLLQRPFVMATMGDISEQNEVVQAWFNYVNSDAGKEVIKAVGLIIPQ